ncbi:MAG TPA: protein translocase subunit SecD [Acidimicrobiia bacterium]|nr:protein translocase subunit SecD [Acidimicrobiia bacterium]
MEPASETTADVTRRALGLATVLIVAWGGLAAATLAGITPKLGLDLQGGTAVVPTAPEGTDPDLLEVAVGVMIRRIEDFGAVQEPDIAISGDDTVVVQLPGVEDEQRAIEAVGQTGLLSFRPVLESFPGPVGPLAGTGTPGIDDETGLTIEDDPTQEAYLLDDDRLGPVVLHLGPAELEGKQVADAVPLFDPNSAAWSVSLEFTSDGAQAFAELTAKAASYPPGDPRRQIAIVLDGEVISAPVVNPGVDPRTGITGGRAQITMGGGEDAQVEANDLAVVLRYGSLPVAFEISSVQKVSGTLGADSLQAGIVAGLLGLALVALALLAVYRSLGLVAILGLTVFASLLIVLFALFGRWQGLTLTLAGVTGIIVSVGITADSYIVYFERLKEKVRGGVDVVEAAEESFRLAYRTILTADTVSLLAAALLWILAVGAVKGFAIALGIATLLDLVVARTFTRRAVNLLAGTRLGAGGWFSIEGAAR